MKKLSIAFLLAAVTLIGAGLGLNRVGVAQAAGPGVATIGIASTHCLSGSSVSVAITWPTLNQGTQYVYWSEHNNGFEPGTYSTHGPLAAGAAGAALTLPDSTEIYAMIGTVVAGELWPGQTMVFTTSDCQDGAYYAPGYPLSVAYPYFGGAYPYGVHLCYLHTVYPYSFLAHHDVLNVCQFYLAELPYAALLYDDYDKYGHYDHDKHYHDYDDDDDDDHDHDYDKHRHDHDYYWTCVGEYDRHYHGDKKD